MWLWGIFAPYLNLSAAKKKAIDSSLSPKCPANIPGLKSSSAATHSSEHSSEAVNGPESKKAN